MLSPPPPHPRPVYTSMARIYYIYVLVYSVYTRIYTVQYIRAYCIYDHILYIRVNTVYTYIQYIRAILVLCSICIV